MSTKFVEWTIFDNAEALANAELKRLSKLQVQRDKAAAALAQATKAYDTSCKNHSYYVRQIMDRDHVHRICYDNNDWMSWEPNGNSVIIETDLYDDCPEDDPFYDDHYCEDWTQAKDKLLVYLKKYKSLAKTKMTEKS